MLGVVKVSPVTGGQEAAKLVEVVRATQGPEGAQSAPVLPQIGSIVIAKVSARALLLPPRMQPSRLCPVLSLRAVARSRWPGVRRW